MPTLATSLQSQGALSIDSRIFHDGQISISLMFMVANAAWDSESCMTVETTPQMLSEGVKFDFALVLVTEDLEEGWQFGQLHHVLTYNALPSNKKPAEAAGRDIVAMGTELEGDGKSHPILRAVPVKRTYMVGKIGLAAIPREALVLVVKPIS